MSISAKSATGSWSHGRCIELKLRPDRRQALCRSRRAVACELRLPRVAFIRPSRVGAKVGRSQRGVERTGTPPIVAVRTAGSS